MLRKLFAVAVLSAATLSAAPILDGPVADSVPPIPAEPSPESRSMKALLSEKMSGDFDLRRRMQGKTPWLKNRISRCCFNRNELGDDVDHFPENYVERLAREGVNGIWLKIKFADYSKALTGDWPADAERRLKKLRRIVGRCGKHGIKLWLFCIEPVEKDFRRDPLALMHPDWIGCTYDNLMGSMCASNPGVQAYIRDTVRDIFTAVPGLGGIIDITNGEMTTSCLSIVEIKSHPCRTNCPICEKLPHEELLHRVERPMVEGMRAAGSDGEFISWIYRSELDGPLPEWVHVAARTQPEGVVQQNNFETGVMLKQEGAWRLGNDYWMSCPGPSMAFAAVAKDARAAGKRLSAKIQVGCSHELATIPVLPVPGLLYRKYKGMYECGVTDVMYSWYMGCAPGMMNRAAGMLAYEDFSDGEEAFLKRLALPEWGEDADRLVKIWKACSDGFANYPLSNILQYYGPYHQSVVWPLRPEIEMRPLGDSWTRGQPAGGDMIGECLMEFSLRDALALAGKMCAELEKIEPELAALEKKYAANRELRRELGLVRAFKCQLAAAKDCFEFYYARRDAVMYSRKGDCAAALKAIHRMQTIIEREVTITKTMKALCLEDSRLGYHGDAGCYLYYPEYFDWRLPTLADSAARLKAIEKEVAEGKGYPLSPLEKSAPVFPARLDENGDLVIEGEVPGPEPVTVYLYDTCGTDWVREYMATPVNGRFRLTVPALDWDNDDRRRPGWIQIHQGCHHMGDKWQYPAHPAFRYRWHHRDLLGFYSARLCVGTSSQP